MGRLGITYQDVARVAEELQHIGHHPTISTIRQSLGSGSSSTIAPYLKQWKAQQANNQVKADFKEHGLPRQFVSMIKELWDTLVHQADLKVTAIRAEHQQELNHMQNALETIQEGNMQWQAQYRQLMYEKDRLAKEKLTIEQEHRMIQQNQVAYVLKQLVLIRELDEKKERINKLYHLQQQSQLNLEHYREAIREQHLLDQAHYAQYQQQLERRFIEQQQKKKGLEKQYVLLKKEYDQKIHEKKTMQFRDEQMQVEQKRLQVLLFEQEQKYKECVQSEKHWQSTYQALQKRLSQQDKMIACFEKKIAVLSQKALYVTQQNKKLVEANNQISHEKWQLGQEKAKLSGQLQQMQILLDQYLHLKVT